MQLLTNKVDPFCFESNLKFKLVLSWGIIVVPVNLKLKIAETMDINVRLYNLTIYGNLFKEGLDEFLSLAYKVYAE